MEENIHDRDIRVRHVALPGEVLDDPSFSTEEKRAILSEWASDACAIPSYPNLRLLPGTSFPVTFAAVMGALLELDRRTEVKTNRTARQSARGSIVALPRRAGPVSQALGAQHSAG